MTGARMRAKGTANKLAGRLLKAAGRATRNRSLRVKGAIKSVGGKMQVAAGRAGRTLGKRATRS